MSWPEPHAGVLALLGRKEGQEEKDKEHMIAEMELAQQ